MCLHLVRFSGMILKVLMQTFEGKEMLHTELHNFVFDDGFHSLKERVNPESTKDYLT